MDTSGPMFAASTLKVNRARKHIAELDALLADHFTRFPPEATVTQEEGSNHTNIHVSTMAPPREVGAIVGDIVHNLRAALDLMAVELVSKQPGANTKGVYFPFCEDPDDLGKIIKKRNFHRAGSDAVQLVESLRPFTGGNIALRALHDLDIQDKHHTLIANAAAVTSPEVYADATDFPNVRIRVVEGSVPKVATVFPEDSPLAREEILPATHMLVELVEGILEAFASLVSARP